MLLAELLQQFNQILIVFPKQRNGKRVEGMLC